VEYEVRETVVKKDRKLGKGGGGGRGEVRKGGEEMEAKKEENAG